MSYGAARGFTLLRSMSYGAARGFNGSSEKPER